MLPSLETNRHKQDISQNFGFSFKHGQDFYLQKRYQVKQISLTVNVMQQKNLKKHLIKKNTVCTYIILPIQT